MRAITKGQEPQEFTDWKALENADWKPTYDDLSGKEKKAVKDALFKEQGGICCYCERRLVDADSHIEHCQPQHLACVDPLDFSNLLCSCQQNIKKGDPRHCGNLKDKWYDDQKFVSPLKPDCTGRFSFLANGTIRASVDTDDAATETIKRLGLDIPKLNNLRKETLAPFLEDELSDDELRQFIAGYLNVSDDGKLPEFISAVEAVFSEWVAA